MNNVLEMLSKAKKFKIEEEKQYYKISFEDQKPGDFYAVIPTNNLEETKYLIYMPNDFIKIDSFDIRINVARTERMLNELKEFCDFIRILYENNISMLLG